MASSRDKHQQFNFLQHFYRKSLSQTTCRKSSYVNDVYETCFWSQRKLRNWCFFCKRIDYSFISRNTACVINLPYEATKMPKENCAEITSMIGYSNTGSIVTAIFGKHFSPPKKVKNSKIPTEKKVLPKL
eukprot:TRINITY_DN4374_c0_g1_i7.p1 TRINITY_DN4374_c0_g1~~TRINITY_DN4374_c0_g1_i7.p1  ORF type:complete len:130 (-),score=19.01 TRINITY_DN4374_c0_g1_i7:262-651(-)